VVKQRIEQCKTEASKKPIPIDAELAGSTMAVAASLRLQPARGLGVCQPSWQRQTTVLAGSLYRVYLKPALEAAGITERVGWHTL